ncbi:MAG: flagellar basal body-associated FliL family protein [Methylococcales bacterium]|nr:flagellar basal body-associated FliL family protein [Methylococcales bacterium]
MRVLMLLLSFFVVSQFVYAGDDESEQAVIEYLEMSPKFTVNLDKPKKYLQISVQLMIEGSEHVDTIKKHLPALRHELIMLYSGQEVAKLQTMQQREALRQETKKVMTKALEKYANSDGFRDVFFTAFLVN